MIRGIQVNRVTLEFPKEKQSRSNSLTTFSGQFSPDINITPINPLAEVIRCLKVNYKTLKKWFFIISNIISWTFSLQMCHQSRDSLHLNLWKLSTRFIICSLPVQCRFCLSKILILGRFTFPIRNACFFSAYEDRYLFFFPSKRERI